MIVVLCARAYYQTSPGTNVGVVDASFVCVLPQVKTRTLTQIRTHAQKYFKKQQEDREREILKEQAAASGLGGGNDVSPPTPTLHVGCLSYAAPTAGTYDPLTPPPLLPRCCLDTIHTGGLWRGAPEEPRAVDVRGASRLRAGPVRA